jgi:methionine synthase II (cobalamin-independent)
MTKTKPPYRADHVGSFLRTAPLKEARAKREKGQITDAQLKAVEDREIEELIKKQEEVGLKLASDGEFRRSWWHFDFYGLLDGVEIYAFDHGIQFQGVQTKAQTPRVKGNADTLAHDYTRILNASLEGKPGDMAITTHVCRGNFRSTWIASGGYEPVAEALFGAVNFDGYFLEYDTERAGGFEPLRFVPKGNKQIVLGLVTSKSGTLEKRDDIKRRIDEASKFVALDQCCLSPQCGFASTENGNILTRISNGRRCGRSSNSPMRYGESDGRRSP